MCGLYSIKYKFEDATDGCFLFHTHTHTHNPPWHLPRPLRPTNRRSLNLATWFFMTAEPFRSSAHQFSSLPALIVTNVPSPTSANDTTLKATGNVLFDRQWLGSAEHRKYGLPVRTEKSQKKNYCEKKNCVCAALTRMMTKPYIKIIWCRITAQITDACEHKHRQWYAFVKWDM